MIVVGVVVKWYTPDRRSFNHPHHQFPHPAIPAVWLAKAFYPAGTTDIVMRKYLSFRGVSVPQQRHFSGAEQNANCGIFKVLFLKPVVIVYIHLHLFQILMLSLFRFQIKKHKALQQTVARNGATLEDCLPGGLDHFVFSRYVFLIGYIPKTAFVQLAFILNPSLIVWSGMDVSSHRFHRSAAFQ